MLDFMCPDHVEVSIRADASVLWVNINGVCALRICRIKTLVLDNQAEPRSGQVTPYQDPQGQAPTEESSTWASASPSTASRP